MLNAILSSPHFIDFVSTLLLTLLSYVGLMVGNYVRSKAQSAKATALLDRVEKLTSSVVREALQTIADDIKAASADGKLTADEAMAIKAHALDRLRLCLGEKTKTELKALLSLNDAGLDAFFSTTLEATLHWVKEGRTVIGLTPTPTPVPASVPVSELAVEN